MNFGADEEMKKALEAELKLDGTDLRSHLWYHGHMSREKAEKQVVQPGHFLVRDCISRPGDYVLTCCWDGKPLHFMINRVLLNSNSVYEKVVYQFEDEQFHQVPDLIRFYVGHKKAVTSASAAVLSTPVNRKLPLSVQGALDRLSFSKGDLNNFYMEGTFHSSTNKPAGKSSGIDNLIIPPISAKLLSRPLPEPPKIDSVNYNRPSLPFARGLSQPHLGSSLTKVASSMTNLAAVKQSRTDQLRSSFANSRNFVSSGDLAAKKLSLTETTSAARASLSDIRQKCGGSLDGVVSSSPTADVVGAAVKPKVPAKPQRAPSIRSKSSRPAVIIRNKLGEFEEVEVDSDKTEANLDDYEFHEYCDIDYEEIDGEVTPKAASQPDVIGEKNKKRPHSVEFMLDRDSACVLDYSSGDKNDLRLTCSSSSDATSSSTPAELSARLIFKDVLLPGIQRSGFTASLLHADYTKPLDDSLWDEIYRLLTTSTPDKIAEAILAENLHFMRQFQSGSAEDNDRSVLPQLGFFFVPQADEFRADFLERCCDLQFFVCSSVLKCDSVESQSSMMAMWIKVAEQLKERLKDHCGFMAVMNALGSKSIGILRTGWTQLRSKHTAEAILYETRLRPSLQAIERCELPEDNRVFFPHLLPITQLMSATSPTDLWLYEWEDRLDDFGLDIFWMTLSQSREWLKREALEKWSFAQSLVTSSGDLPLNDVFRTEFQMRFLWGTKGETVATPERHSKLSQLLILLAERHETLNNSAK